MGVKKTLFKILPEHLKVPVWLMVQKLTGRVEAELLEVPRLVEPGTVAIDVGANIGLYTYVLAKKCSKVIAFEPNPNCAETLQSLKLPNVEVKVSGVSDKPGELTFYIPLNGTEELSGLASFIKAEGENKELKVPVITIDELDLDSLGFIKIDVEGFEREVLHGAEKTLNKFKPTILIEIEQRHINFPIQQIFDFILSIGYKGFFLSGKEYRELGKFSVEDHQNKYLEDVLAGNYGKTNGLYINNFIFKPN